MTARIPIICLLGLLSGLATGAAGARAAEPSLAAAETKDIRVLIDVSGSMQWNDPENLRAPALRLLTGLLPSGTRAGVWTFGRYVNMLVPYGEVDRAWKDKARQAADQINSAGLFTNIESTLERATWNWHAPAADAERSIILLTDGLVDVSENPEADQASRARIVEQILPRLQRAGATVHTIALSGEADETLLQQLAAATGGWFEHPKTAQHLERVFFRMFEKAARPETLPLVDNEVLVDKSIEEITLLIFRKQGASPTTLVTPDGVTFGKDRVPPNVAWHSDDRYDLVTITRPMTGTWHVNAEVDPDNRVMVVANLRVIATRLPNQILSGDLHDLYVRLAEGNGIIEKRDFLHFIEMTVVQESEHGETHDWMLLDNGRGDDATAGDGTYSLRLGDSLSAGEHELTISVDGTTFRREHRQTVKVVTSPVVTRVADRGVGPELYVLPRADIVTPDTLKVVATVTGSEGRATAHTVPRTGPNEWRLALAEYAKTRHQVTVEIKAERPSGKPLAYRTEPIEFGSQPSETDTAEPSPAQVSAPAPHVASGSEPTSAAPSDAPRESGPVEPATHWSLVALQVLLINLLLGGGIYLAYRKWFRNATPPAAQWEEFAHE